MIKTIARIVLALLLLAACGSAPVLADSGPVPYCWPHPCTVVTDGGDPMPLCWPGHPCRITS